jgi:hypothetical protein
MMRRSRRSWKRPGLPDRAPLRGAPIGTSVRSYASWNPGRPFTWAALDQVLDERRCHSWFFASMRGQCFEEIHGENAHRFGGGLHPSVSVSVSESESARASDNAPRCAWGGVS